MKKRLCALYESELEEALSRFNLIKKFQAGELKCYFCGTVLTRKNLGFIFYTGEKVEVSCDSALCTSQAITFSKRR